MENLLEEVLEMKMMVDLLDGKDNVADFDDQVAATKSKLSAIEILLKELKSEQLQKLNAQKALIERLQRLHRRYDYMIKNKPQVIPDHSEKENKQENKKVEVAQKTKKEAKEPEKPKAAAKQVEALKPKAKVDQEPTPEPRKGLEASINYVSNSEMEKISSYMRGRLKLADVNALVDNYNNVLNKKEKLMRKKPLKSKEEMDLVQMWKEQSRCSSLQGQYFCSVDDFKTQENLKFGKKEFSIIVILRHVNKIKEVRERGKIFYVACF